LVGDLRTLDQESKGTEFYTDFFASDCKPPLTDIKVEAIGHKLREFLPRLFLPNNPSFRTVKGVFDAVCEVQGHKLQGEKRQAVEGAVQSIHECLKRNFKKHKEGVRLYLTPEELALALAKLGWEIPIPDMDRLVKKFDINQDRKIDEQELLNLLLWLKKDMVRNRSRQELLDLPGKGAAKGSSVIGMVPQDNGVPTRDAFWVMPVREESYAKVISVRNQVQYLKSFESDLKSAVSQGSIEQQQAGRYVLHRHRSFVEKSGSVSSTPSSAKGRTGGKLGLSKLQPLPPVSCSAARYDAKTQTASLVDGTEEIAAACKTPAGPTASGEKVLTIVREWHEKGIVGIVKSLLLKMTVDDDDNALSREGNSDSLMQKLVRECQGIEITMSIIEIIFAEGVSADLVEREEKYSHVKLITTHLYRLMKQTVKENNTNAMRLFPFVDTIQSHLGKGISAMQVMKELFIERRPLINQITEKQIEKIVSLLRHVKNPTYIDFLLSICTCKGSPMPTIQEYITDLLLVKNERYLPQLKLDDGILWVLLDDDHETPEWLNVCSFKKQVERAGKIRDLAGEIMTKPYAELERAEKTFGYFVRCSNLFGKLALGRNQKALRKLLLNEKLGLSYSNILQIMSMKTLPLLVRACFTSLMNVLWVDRAPNFQRPFILYTRVWTRHREGINELEDAEFQTPDAGGGEREWQRESSAHAATTGKFSASIKTGLTRQAASFRIPVCENNFSDLVCFLLKDLKEFGDTAGRNTNIPPAPAITAHFITYGQIEYMSAQVNLCLDMLRLSLFTKDRNSVSANFDNGKALFDGLFAIVEIVDPQTLRLKTKEGLLLMELRSLALKTIILLCDLRANFRISQAVHTYERVFNEMQQNRFNAAALGKSSIYRSDSLDSRCSLQRSDSLGSVDSSFEFDHSIKAKRLRNMFQSCEVHLVSLARKCFSNSIICPEHIGADKALESNEKNTFIERLLALCGYENKIMTETVVSLIIRQGSQKVRFTHDLSLVSILVFPDSIRVFQTCNKVIRRFTVIQNQLNLDQRSAYGEASQLLKGIKAHLTVDNTGNSRALVQSNQKMMMDLKFEVVIVNILRLPLARENAVSDDLERVSSSTVEVDSDLNITAEPDNACNELRRILFQEAFGELPCQYASMKY